jgi:hypothetical protein
MTSRRRPESRTPFTLVGGAARFLLLLAGLPFACMALGCSSNTAPHPEVALPAECGSFLAQFERCLVQALPSTPDVGRARAAQTRASLLHEAQRADAAALSVRCKANLERLNSSCVVPGVQ